jgi:hypothetical protein
MLDQTFSLNELEDKIYNLVKDFPEINSVELIMNTLKLDPKFKSVQNHLIPKVIFGSGRFGLIRTKIVAITN